MARNKAEFDKWLTEIINDLNASDSVSVSASNLEPKHWKQIWQIYDDFVQQKSRASYKEQQIIEEQSAIAAKGVLLESAGTDWEEFEINQEIDRLLDKGD